MVVAGSATGPGIPHRIEPIGNGRALPQASHRGVGIPVLHGDCSLGHLVPDRLEEGMRDRGIIIKDVHRSMQLIEIWGR